MSRSMHLLRVNDLLLVFCVLLSIIRLVGGRTTPQIKEEIFSTSSAITSFSPGGQYVMLTFDNGPHAYITGRILDILRDKNASATFFVQGSRAYDHPLILKRLAEYPLYLSTCCSGNEGQTAVIEKLYFLHSCF